MENALSEEVEFGAAVHLPLEQFEPVDLAFHGTIAPRERHGRTDGSQIVAKAVGKTSNFRGTREHDARSSQDSKR